MIRQIFMFYGWMTIIAAMSMAIFAIFATDVSLLGEDAEDLRQVMLFLAVPMSIGMGVLFIMIGRGGTNTPSPSATEKHETTTATSDASKGK